MIRRSSSRLRFSLVSVFVASAAISLAEEKPAHEPAPEIKPPTNALLAPSATVVEKRPGSAEKNAALQPAPVATTPAAKLGETTKPRATDEPHGLLNLGATLTDRGDYDAAEIAFRQVLNAKTTAPNEIKSALLGLARMHRKQGALTKAAAIYERFLKDYPGDERTPDALLDLGRTLRALGVYKLAIARFYNVINSTLKLPAAEGFDHYQALAKTAQFEIAETHFQAGEYAEAGKFFSRLRLLDLAPADRARAHFKAAYSLRLGGNLDEAVSTFRAYIAQWPDDENVPEARYLLAVTLRDLKHSQEAFQATLDLLHEEKSRVAGDPKRWAYWQRRTGNQLANDFFENGDMLNAHAIYSGLVELSPDPAWRLPIVYQLALCYERLGIPDRARTAYQSIVDGVGANAPADLTELSRMAAWRIDNLDWHDRVAKQVTSFFETTTGKTGAVAATAPKTPSTDVTANPGAPTKTEATP